MMQMKKAILITPFLFMIALSYGQDDRFKSIVENDSVNTYGC